MTQTSGKKTERFFYQSFEFIREIGQLAIEVCKLLKVELIQAVTEGTLSISAVIWTDIFEQNNYLRTTAHFVDNNNTLHTLDLCVDHTTNSISELIVFIKYVKKDALREHFKIFAVLPLSRSHTAA